jgi:hypothetical protein
LGADSIVEYTEIKSSTRKQQRFRFRVQVRVQETMARVSLHFPCLVCCKRPLSLARSVYNWLHKRRGKQAKAVTSKQALA